MKKLSLRLAAAAIAATLVVPAFAASSPAMMKSDKHPKVTVDTACMATAVSARDTAISTALSTVVTALQTRGTALAAAWSQGTADARKAAVKAANDAFKGSWKTFNAARKKAWTDYATAAKACHGSAETPASDSGTM